MSLRKLVTPGRILARAASAATTSEDGIEGAGAEESSAPRPRQGKQESGQGRAEDLEALRAEILRRGNVPRHVAIIMDGNGRWAERQGLPRIAGHQAGRRSVREAVEGCAELDVGYLTLYAFSVENWNRPRAEVQFLMRFFRQVLIEERDELKRNKVRLTAIGRLHDLPRSVQAELRRTIEYLADGEGLCLNLAISYGGRAELVDGIRRMLVDAEKGLVHADGVDEALVQRYLYTAELPNPDLLIRTSGEMRISNFLLWQLAYSEIWVTDVLWPDFRKLHLFKGISAYQKRQRRFGRVVES